MKPNDGRPDQWQQRRHQQFATLRPAAHGFCAATRYQVRLKSRLLACGSSLASPCATSASYPKPPARTANPMSAPRARGSGPICQKIKVMRV